ncbi:MAG: lytic murein transglycosylase B [Porticoccaceae bacterium]|nr:lytic murein transglycosylase B [Porticoccaceae bacterium]
MTNILTARVLASGVFTARALPGLALRGLALRGLSLRGLVLQGLALLGLTLLGTTTAHARNYDDNPATQALIDSMVAEHQFERPALEKLFAEAEYKQSIIDAMTRPAEKVKEWKDYRKIFVTKKRINQGVDFWHDNRATLERAQRDYGVDPAIIVAILGVETYYGRLTGSYRVLDALSTLAFDYPPRSTFFAKELKEFLLLSREQNKKANELTGSYAGAMGYGQFIPSSYRAYAVDYTGDDFADIWDNPVDAIGSVANYFARHGWQTGQAVVVRARVGKDYVADHINDVRPPELTLATLRAQGFTPVGERADGSWDDNTKAFPLKLEGKHGAEFWLAFDNFYVITRYNHSRRYAMAVYQLAEEIRAQLPER